MQAILEDRARPYYEYIGWRRELGYALLPLQGSNSIHRRWETSYLLMRVLVLYDQPLNQRDNTARGSGGLSRVSVLLTILFAKDRTVGAVVSC